MAIQRRHYLFTGRVQGVGFRYRAMYAALRLNLTGWVQNNDDGSVELEAQGEEPALNALLSTILNTSRWIDVENADYTLQPPQPEERSFQVRE